MKKSNSDSLIDVTVINADYIKDYIIKFKFSDNTTQKINFKKFIEQGFGGCDKYLNKDLFKGFNIIDGKDISWNDYEMSFPFIFLYEGDFDYELV